MRHQLMLLSLHQVQLISNQVDRRREKSDEQRGRQERALHVGNTKRDAYLPQIHEHV